VSAATAALERWVIKSASQGVETLDVCYDNVDGRAGEYYCLLVSPHHPPAAAAVVAVRAANVVETLSAPINTPWRRTQK